MNISRILAALLAIGCVALGAATLNLVQQKQDLKAQLTAMGSVRPETGWRGERMGEHGGLRQALEAEQDANAELRQELARLKGEPPPPKPSPAPVPSADASMSQQNRWGGGGEAWLDRMKQQDPERYKQFVAERDQRRKEAEEWYDKTQGQLQARAQLPVSPDEATLVTQISDTLQKYNELRQQAQAARNLPDDQRQTVMTQLMPELQTTYQQLSTLREQDRTLQFQNLATQLGLKGENAQTLVNTIPQIYKNTQQYMPGRTGGGFGGGFGGPGSGSTAPASTPPAR